MPLAFQGQFTNVAALEGSAAGGTGSLLLATGGSDFLLLVAGGANTLLLAS